MDELRAPHVATRDIQRAAQFTFEVVQNTRDHGATHLHGERIDGVRFVVVRLLPLRTIAPRRRHADPVQDYCARLVQAKGLGPETPRSALEITVADCGVGIPARITGQMEIYSKSISEERTALVRALVLRTTSKPATQTGAGYGLYSAMLATQDLRGLALVRTGRLLLYKDFLNNEHTAMSDWAHDERPFVAGTSVSLFFPLFESGQGRLAF
jgi:hypothetical protein